MVGCSPIDTPVAPSPNGDRAPAPGRSFRLVAYNFLSGGSPRRTGHWSRVLARLAADVVLAQECRSPEEAPGERFRPSPTDTLVWAPVVARRWGSAVLVRALPATPLEIPEFAGWVAGAELVGPGWWGDRPLRLFSIHCPVGSFPIIKLGR